MHPIFQQAIANCIPDDGSLIAVIPPVAGMEFFAPFLLKEPLGAKVVKTLPSGMRIIRKDDGKLQLAISGLQLAWGLDHSRDLLPERYFIGEKNSFAEKVNKRLGYAAVQRPDYIHGILKYPDKVSFSPLAEPVIVMNSDGYVSHGPMLPMLLKLVKNPDAIIQQILDKTTTENKDFVRNLTVEALGR